MKGSGTILPSDTLPTSSSGLVSGYVSVAVDATGQYLAAATTLGTLDIWEHRRGQPVECRGRVSIPRNVARVQFGPLRASRGERALYAATGDGVVVVDISSLSVARTIAMATATDVDGRQVATGS